MEGKSKIEVYLNEQLKEEQIKVPMLDYETNEEGNYQYTTKIYEQPNKIGSIVLDFIQKDLKEMSYFIFRFYGFQTLLTEKERKEILALNPNEMVELDNKMEELYSKYQKEFENFKIQIIDILEYCLFNEKKELKDLSPIEKLHIFVNTKNIEEYPILKYNEFNKVIKINKDTSKITEKELIRRIKDKDNNRYGIQEIYQIHNFYNLLFLELYFILQEKIYLKKCKNCGKYFLTTNSAVIYCDNMFEDNKTCREIGASKVFTKNLEKDEAYNLYRKVYKKKQALAKSKGGSFEIEYNLFKNQGKDKKNAYKLKEISKEEFMKWLNKQ
ncbi:MAG: hypothetical protein IJV31_02295 [Clostridia bacterium]|nr:hypothetical protein [Clostridia bacterium]